MKSCRKDIKKLIRFVVILVLLGGNGCAIMNTNGNTIARTVYDFSANFVINNELIIEVRTGSSQNYYIDIRKLDSDKALENIYHMDVNKVEFYDTEKILKQSFNAEINQDGITNLTDALNSEQFVLLHYWRSSNLGRLRKPHVFIDGMTVNGQPLRALKVKEFSVWSHLVFVDYDVEVISDSWVKNPDNKREFAYIKSEITYKVSVSLRLATDRNGYVHVNEEKFTGHKMSFTDVTMQTGEIILTKKANFSERFPFSYREYDNAILTIGVQAGNKTVDLEPLILKVKLIKNGNN